MKNSLTGYWNEDRWDLRECPLESSNELKQAKHLKNRWINFGNIKNTWIKTELKFFYYYKLINDEWKPGTVWIRKGTVINNLISFLSKKYPNITSIVAEEFSEVKDVKGDLIEEVYQGTKGGEVVGYTIKTTPKGYGGKVEVMVGISNDGKISGVKIGNHSETPGLGSKSADPSFKDQYNGKSTKTPLNIVKGNASNENDIVAISGATITSKAVTAGVNAAMDVYEQKLISINGTGE
ncbi:FMN-binding protein (plasmid) [Paraclostridium bifermentans]|uniref:FMN-binding protein n=2 Tax=Paraclostridium bifermentans TaxID=1490 RepID=A0A5P3XKM1_PARBF|nr:FMN-binding protein [Paraclostridium bifermentans]